MTCPLCDQPCANRIGLGVHLRKRHGVLGTNAGYEAKHAPKPKRAQVATPRPYGPALSPDYAFRDALLGALENVR